MDQLQRYSACKSKKTCDWDYQGNDDSHTRYYDTPTVVDSVYSTPSYRTYRTHRGRSPYKYSYVSRGNYEKMDYNLSKIDSNITQLSKEVYNVTKMLKRLSLYVRDIENTLDNLTTRRKRKNDEYGEMVSSKRSRSMKKKRSGSDSDDTQNEDMIDCKKFNRITTIPDINDGLSDHSECEIYENSDDK